MRVPSLCFSILAGALPALAGCMTSHLARAVGRGNTRVNVSAGGPMVLRGSAPIPVPITTVGVAHGLEDYLDVHADVGTTALAFRPDVDGAIPTLALDGGFAWHPVPGHRNALTIGGALYGITNRVDAVLFVDLWLAGAHRVNSWFAIAGGLHNMVRLGASDPAYANTSVWAPSAFANLAFRPFSGRVEIELEGRWYAFTEHTSPVVPPYVGLGDLGALGVLLGFNYQFGGGYVP